MFREEWSGWRKTPPLLPAHSLKLGTVYFWTTHTGGRGGGETPGRGWGTAVLSHQLVLMLNFPAGACDRPRLLQEALSLHFPPVSPLLTTVLLQHRRLPEPPGISTRSTTNAGRLGRPGWGDPCRERAGWINPPLTQESLGS